MKVCSSMFGLHTNHRICRLHFRWKRNGAHNGIERKPSSGCLKRIFSVAIVIKTNILCGIFARKCLQRSCFTESLIKDGDMYSCGMWRVLFCGWMPHSWDIISLLTLFRLIINITFDFELLRELMRYESSGAWTYFGQMQTWRSRIIIIWFCMTWRTFKFFGH